MIGEVLDTSKVEAIYEDVEREKVNKRIKEKYNIDMMKSWMIGDKDADIVSANKSGISNTILVRSGHAINQSTSNAKFILDSIRDSKKIIVI